LNQKQRIKALETVLFKLYFTRLTFDHFKQMDILNLIDAYNFADNASNGEASEYEIRKKKDSILERIGGL
jgi:hypothetical protein